MKKVPGKFCLIEIKNPIEAGPKCSHTKPGCWILNWEGKLYAFTPSTQLQKDIWIRNAEDAGVPQDKIYKALRWRCGECNTHQDP